MKLIKKNYPPEKELKKIYKKETLSPAMSVIMCPKCKTICASASEKMYLPKWSTCDNVECSY